MNLLHPRNVEYTGSDKLQMENIILTTEMWIVLALLAFTVALFATEIVRVDVAAILVMVLLGTISYIPSIEPIVDVNHLFDGFASNAVISIIAVMIIGAGLDKTGLMGKVAAAILKHGGSTERRVVPIISGVVGIISSFMQNVGAAALFLPVVSRISTRTGLPLSRLLMPMGFCAILGGTMTMVGSSPLILLNDLLISANLTLPDDQQMELFSLFSVTPIGMALVLSGIVYFIVLGAWVLPKSSVRQDGGAAQRAMADYLETVYELDTKLVEIEVPAKSSIHGTTLEDLLRDHQLTTIGYFHKGQREVGPVVSMGIQTPCRLVMIGRARQIHAFSELNGLRVLPELDLFADPFDPENAGVAELVIPPESNLIGKSAREQRFRKTYGLSVLSIRRGEEKISDLLGRESNEKYIGEVPLKAGDTLAVFTKWQRLRDCK